MANSNIIILGAGGHGRSVAEIVICSREFNLVGFVDDAADVNKKIWDYPILGTIEDLPKLKNIADWAIIAIGNNASRLKLFELLKSIGFNIATICHPQSIISPSAILGEGTVVMANGIIGTEAKLGVGVIVNSGAVVDHHCQVHNFGHLGVNSSMAGGSTLGERAWMQAGSSLGYGVNVAADAIVLPGVGVK